jgi:hypothetical protein
MVDPVTSSVFHQFLQLVLSENGSGGDELQRLITKGELREEEAVIIQLHANAEKTKKKLDKLLAKLEGLP